MKDKEKRNKGMERKKGKVLKMVERKKREKKERKKQTKRAIKNDRDSKDSRKERKLKERKMVRVIRKYRRKKQERRKKNEKERAIKKDRERENMEVIGTRPEVNYLLYSAAPAASIMVKMRMTRMVMGMIWAIMSLESIWSQQWYIPP